MELQKQLLDFQQTFDEGSSSSKQTSVIPSLYQRAEQVLLGSLLGDGHLHKNSKNSIPTFREKHSIKQKEYLEWKVNILKYLIIIKTKEFFILEKWVKRYKYNNYTYIQSQSLTHLILSYYYNLFYPNGKKIVTREILDKLEPLGLAVWYCDDGNYNYGRNRVSISTMSFTKVENNIIKEWLSKRFHIYCKIIKQKERYCIEISNLDKSRFLELIKPYVPECMSYKLGFDIERKIKAKNRRIEYYIKNKDRIIREHLKWQKENRDYCRKKCSEYYYKNKDKFREYKLKNRDKINTYMRNYTKLGSKENGNRYSISLDTTKDEKY